jgi:hypothetical protein
MPFPAPAILAGLRPVEPSVLKQTQAGDASVSPYYYIATITTITAIGTSIGHKLLPPKAHYTVTTITSFHYYLYSIKHNSSPIL